MQVVDRFLKRAIILRQVEAGELDRDAAQALVEEQGLGPLLPSPDLTAPLYDPLHEPRWTLLMAVTWVAFRRIDLVQKYSNVVRSMTGTWIRSGDGFVVTKQEPVWLHPIASSLHDDELADAFGGGDVPGSFQKGWQMLRQKLAGGDVRGYARDLLSGIDSDVKVIPAENWNALMLCKATGGHDGFRMMFSDAIRYIGIEIERSELIYQFPSKSNEPQSDHGAVEVNSSDLSPPSKPKRGRKPGSKNYSDAAFFLDEYRLGLRASGEPGKQNPPPWDSLAAAAAHVLGVYCAGLKSDDVQPSLTTAVRWAQEATAEWIAEGSPRDADAKSNNSRNAKTA